MRRRRSVSVESDQTVQAASQEALPEQGSQGNEAPQQDILEGGTAERVSVVDWDSADELSGQEAQEQDSGVWDSQDEMEGASSTRPNPFHSGEAAGPADQEGLYEDEDLDAGEAARLPNVDKPEYLDTRGAARSSNGKHLSRHEEHDTREVADLADHEDHYKDNESERRQLEGHGGEDPGGDQTADRHPGRDFDGLAHLPYYDPQILDYCKNASVSDLNPGTLSHGAFCSYLQSLIHPSRVLPDTEDEWCQVLHPDIVELLGADVEILSVVSLRGKLLMRINLQLLDISCEGLATDNFLLNFAKMQFQSFLDKNRIVERQADGWAWVAKDVPLHVELSPDIIYRLRLASPEKARMYHIL
jgi:hypothetical protein